MKRFLASAALGLLGLFLLAQDHDHNRDRVQHTPEGQGELNAATEAMSRGHHHEGHEHMGAHMHMSELRTAQPGDSAKAQHVVNEARPALEHYRDYKVALDDGYRIFLPNVPQ